jgi:hypothetical protein
MVPTTVPTTVPPTVVVPQPIQSTFTTTVQIQQQSRTTLQNQLGAALNSSITVTGNQFSLNQQDGNLVGQIDAQGVTSGVQIDGPINVTIGNLTISTNDGEGTASLNLGNGVTVGADARLTVGNNSLNVVLENPVLNVNPRSPSPAQLQGGNPQVQNIGAGFTTPLQNLPDGAQMTVQFTKDPSSFVPNAGAIFSLGAQQVGGQVANPTTDVAFAVQVTKTGIANDQLGDNSVRLSVDQAWYEARLAEGKGVVITKVADDGTVFTQVANCVVSGNQVDCRATFTGPAAGFSLFALMAVAQAPGATLAPTPTLPGQAGVTPVPPTATATPTPTVDEGGSSVGLIVGIVVAVVVIGGAAFFLLTRKKS